MTIGIHKTGESPARNIEDMINWLASFGESGEGGGTRLLYSKPWLSAQRFRRWSAGRGTIPRFSARIARQRCCLFRAGTASAIRRKNGQNRLIL